MSFIFKDSYTCYFINSDTEKSFPSKLEAMMAARRYCGNNLHKPVFGPSEETWLFGPGDGTTSVIVKRDVEFVPDDKENK